MKPPLARYNIAGNRSGGRRIVGGSSIVAIAALCVAVGCASAGCTSDPVAANTTGDGGGGMTTGEGGQGAGATGGAGGAEVPAEEDPYDAPPAVEPLPNDVVTSLGQTLDSILANQPAQSHSVLVVGAETGQVIYERNPDLVLKPASNTKLFTTATAMAMLGDQHHNETVVYATSAPSGGVINGSIVMIGDHDFTWSTRFYDNPQFPLQQLSEAIAALGITEVNGPVEVRGEVLFDGYSLGTYSAATERAQAVSSFANALTSAGIATQGTSTSATAAVPAGSVELARWRSLPVDVGNSPVNRVSHNEFADIQSRHIGWVLGGQSSYAAGESEMIALLNTAPADAGGLGSGAIDTSGVVLNDGSGLSHGNRVSARHVVSLLHLMQQRSEGAAWMQTFSVAGTHGTIGGRLGGPNTLGRFFGKTGTLSDTIALSGVLEHIHDGQRYFISCLMNGVTNKTTARSTHDQIVSAVAADIRSLSDVPAAPVLQTVHNDANAQTAVASWAEVADVDGYIVWRSPNGRGWDRDEARFVQALTHRTVAFDVSPSLYIRVSAVRGGFESDPSDTYGVRVSDDRSHVLVVDGNDRWEADPSPENHLRRGHDFVVRYGEAITGAAFDSCANEAVVSGACPLAGYDTVIWSLGEESSTHLALDDDEIEALTAFTSVGGALVIWGAQLGYQLAETVSGLGFLELALGVDYAGDDAGTFSFRSVDDGLVTDQVMSFLTPDRMLVSFPDQFTLLDGSSTFLEYVGGTAGVAGVKFSGAHRAVTLGFPIESIDSREDRTALLDSVFAFFGEQ